MKYLMHLTAPVVSKPEADNLRGEPRWERNVLSALLSQGKQVHTTNKIWNSSEPKPENLYNGLNPDWIKDSVLISHGVPKDIFTGNMPMEALECPYKIIQYHDGPDDITKDTFLKYNGKIVTTTSSKAWLYKQRLEQTLGCENVEWVPGPVVPGVREGSNFDKPYLVWIYRNFCTYSQEKRVELKQLFDQVECYVRYNPNLKIKILMQPTNETCRDNLKDWQQWFYSQDFASAFFNYSSRPVEILTDLHWYQILELLSNTKLIISPAEPLGGPPFEAGSFGIPTILDTGVNPFCDINYNHLFNGVLTAPNGINPTFLQLLNTLHKDKQFYDTHGNAYRNFIREHATYEAYVNKIDNIIKQKGWN